jgi:hypothetical protein
MLVYQLDEAPDQAKAILIEVIAEKRDPAYFQAIYDQIPAGGKARAASIAHLFKVASHEHLEVLMQLFDPLEDEDEQAHVEQALVESVLSIRIKPLLYWPFWPMPLKNPIPANTSGSCPPWGEKRPLRQSTLNT